MRVHRAWTTFEYCWRFGIRPLMWLVRIVVVVGSAATITILLDHVSALGMFTVVLCYGIYAVTEAIKGRVPPVHIVRADIVDLSSVQHLRIPEQQFDAAVERILARREA